MYWQEVLARLSIPGVVLLAIGLLLGYGATWLSRVLFKSGGERAIVPMKVVGMAATLLGALILLDIIPI